MIKMEFVVGLVLLQLFQLLISSNSALVASAASGVATIETTEVPWCGRTDSGYSCVARQGQLLIIPCGDFIKQQGLSFTYYLKHPQQLLSNATTDYLNWYPKWNQTGVQICCAPNVSISIMEVPCYEINVQYPPKEIQMKWPVGISKWPIYGSPYELNCPLQSNPTATYSWTKYQTLSRKVKVNFTDDVIFSNNGRKWQVKSYSSAHNGVYVCYASNSLGAEEYSDDSLFLLKPDLCSHTTSANSTLTISPQHTSNNKPGDNITITCLASSTQTYGLKPYWFFMRNGSKEFCRPPLYSRQDPKRDEESCVWTNSLTVKEFSKEMVGQYYCQYGNQSVVQNVEMEVCYTHEDSDVSINISRLSPSKEGRESVNRISCVAHNVSKSHEIKWILPNTTDICPETPGTYCAPSAAEYEVELHYDSSTCHWTCDLVIKGFVVEGEYECIVSDGSSIVARATTTLAKKDMMMFRPDNTKNYVIATSAVLGVVLSLIVITIILVVIQRLRKPSFTRSKEPQKEGFTYDVFISAHDETRELVKQRILLPLEQHSDPPYKVCWHLRDFIAGVSINEQIADAVNQSRKILFVFSEHFSESKFCQLELDLAINRLVSTRTRCVVPIALKVDAVPKRLKEMLTYWPVVLASDDSFSERIKQLIGDPIKMDGLIDQETDNESLIVHS